MSSTPFSAAGRTPKVDNPSRRLDTPGGETAGYAYRVTLYLLLFLLCLATYHGIYDNYLFNDDFSWLRMARHEMEPGNLFSFKVVDFFRPLINLSFYTMEHLFPGNIPLHYSVNLVLHFLNCILVFRLIMLLLHRRLIAAAAAVLFAVTAVHTGAVLWISARTTLLSTLLLLASFCVLLSRPGNRTRSVLLATGLYILALSAKETAIAGLPILILIVLLKGTREDLRNAGAFSIVTFAIVSAAYLVTRNAMLGGFIQNNWGPGIHVARNAAGGFLYQFYPFPLFSLFWPRGTYIPEPAHPFIPEVLVIPVVAVLIWLGTITRKVRPVLLATGWTLIALIPASAFTYRFFSTESITQSRYYYLSSVGSVLLIILLLSMIWDGASRRRKIVSAALLLLLCAGSILRAHRLERKWDHFTGMYHETIKILVEEAEKQPDITNLAIKDPPLAFPYMEDALLLYNPAWKVYEAASGRREAFSLRPCLYISYTDEYPKVISIERIE